MPDEREYEYDLAVSFAGEERDYVRGVVRGLGEDLKVFYDEDNKATLLGENLLDFFTDLYMNKARFAAMFVSHAYSEKMWTNVERQAVMARASQQRTAYMLPIRMDETQLPGLLPTIGYADARIEGLDGIISILGEKLGGKRVNATYAGRVPQTQADIDLLLALRPRFWEFWLYGGVLKVGMAKLEEKYLDYEMGYAKRSGVTYYGAEAHDFLLSSRETALAICASFTNVLSHDIQVKAFGEPGVPGDPDRIIHMAQRLLDVYEAFMDEAARLLGASLPDSCRRAQVMAAKFGVESVENIRQFVRNYEEQASAFPEMVAGQKEGDEPIALQMAVTLDVDSALVDEFNAGLQECADAI